MLIVFVYIFKFNKVLIMERLFKYKLDLKKVKINILDRFIKVGDIFVNLIELVGLMLGYIGFDFIILSGDYLFMFNFVEVNLGIYGNLDFDEMFKKFFVKRKIKVLIVDLGNLN